MKKRGHGIALFSGGLDSALAILLLLRQDIEVTALSFMNHFGCDLSDRSSCGHDPYPVADKFGFTVKMVHLADKFVQIVKDPKYGHGKNMNPCIDCRILMLREAKQFMEIVGADFVFTGEVVGQRPMSQRKPQLNIVARDADLKGKLLRPLSAKLLPPTEVELSGLVDRDRLEAISGRSRKRQIELAEKYGLEDYPNPAAGCLLTDQSYSNRLRDFLAHNEHLSFDDLNLMRVGRHFRLDRETVVIVGRNEEENNKIERYRNKTDWLFEAIGTGSPVTLLKGPLNDSTIKATAEITARYCRKRDDGQIEISYYQTEDQLQTIMVAPAVETELVKVRL